MPGLAKMLKPVASAYTHIAGYRQMGLKYDDLIIEEREDVQKVSSSHYEFHIVARKSGGNIRGVRALSGC